jgi:hypothetical protein
MKLQIKLFLWVLVCLFFVSCTEKSAQEKSLTGDPKKLTVAENGRYLITGDGKPFFWLGDTGWLFNRLNREEIIAYLENRRQKGFNVIQVMLLHNVDAHNAYLDSALRHGDISKPAVTPGNNFANATEYDYWDNVDEVIKQASKIGLYMALVPVWGTNVKEKKVNKAQAVHYAKFLAERYKNQWNIIWLNGGDIKGSDGKEIWEAIGETLDANDPNHLITFHPRGRTTSSDWFHHAKWLDFNMVQSGHRRYEQDTSKKEKNHFGQDNYKYIQIDYHLKPTKPTIDGEPSYEDIPQGLHDVNEPRWTAADVRRYGYWSVFAGAFGYTYGHNSVMQMYRKTDLTPAYGPHEEWLKALDSEGAKQMIHLKNLMLSRSFLDRVPDQSLIVNNGIRYNRVAATRGNNYVMAYTYTGAAFTVDLAKLKWSNIKISWFNPRNGQFTKVDHPKDQVNVFTFKSPGKAADGNDWVLVIDKI